MVIFGLGSNVGDRLSHLREASLALERILTDFQASSIYESPALLPPDAPLEWNQGFYNMAVCGETVMWPEALLAEVKKFEASLGRIDRGHWGPREIDIDILAMDEVLLETPELTIPHKDLLTRDFALVPLVEIAPTWRHPLTGHYGSDICAQNGFHLEKIGNL